MGNFGEEMAKLIKEQESKKDNVVDKRKFKIREPFPCPVCKDMVIPTSETSTHKKYCSTKCANKHSNDKYYKTNTGKYHLAKKDANRKFDISFEDYIDLIKSGRCYYCAGELNKGGTKLDRVNSDIHYTKENCVACCKSCNMVKSNLLSKGEMLQVVSLLRRIRGGNVW